MPQGVVVDWRKARPHKFHKNHVAHRFVESPVLLPPTASIHVGGERRWLLGGMQSRLHAGGAPVAAHLFLMAVWYAGVIGVGSARGADAAIERHRSKRRSGRMRGGCPHRGRGASGGRSSQLLLQLNFHTAERPTCVKRQPGESDQGAACNGDVSGPAWVCLSTTRSPPVLTLLCRVLCKEPRPEDLHRFSVLSRCVKHLLNQLQRATRRGCTWRGLSGFASLYAAAGLSCRP